MPATWKTVRVFISSTFRDMQAERDHLVRFVFPRLREELLKRRIHLVDVDLRWGVTSDQDALGVCHEIIDECKPRFLCMLGGRYGWTPPGKQHSITAAEVQHVLDRRGEHRYTYFYFRDPTATDAVVEPVAGEFREPAGSDNDRKLRELKRAIAQAGFQPFLYPARWDAQQRRLVGLKEFGDRIHADLLAGINDQFGAEAPAAVDEFADENAAMEAFIEERTERYIVGSRQSVLDEMRHFVNADGAPNILVLTGTPGSGKSALLAKWVKELVDHEEHEGHEEGKAENPASSIQHPASVVLIPHFIGASAGSTNLRRTLRRFCHELQRAIGVTDPVPEEVKELLDKFPALLQQAARQRRVILVIDALNQFDATDNAPYMEWLPRNLPPNVRVIVSVLGHPPNTRITPKEGPEAPSPRPLPQGARESNSQCAQDGISSPPLFTGKERGEDKGEGDRGALSPQSSVLSPSLAVLRRREGQIREINLRPLTRDDSLAIIHGFLKRYHKRVSAEQVEALLGKPESGSPLYLLVALEELRTLGTYEEITHRIQQLPGEVRPLFRWILVDRLENDDGFRDSDGQKIGHDLVRKYVSFIGVSRHGMSQSELVDLIVPGDPLGNVAALQRLLQPYLMRRGELLDFYHGQLREAVEGEYLDEEQERLAAHRALASYFRREADPDGDLTWNGAYPRGLTELPYHLYQGAQRQGLVDLLCQITYVDARCIYSDVYDLIGNYDWLAGSPNCLASQWQAFIRKHAQRLDRFPSLLFTLVHHEGFAEAQQEARRMAQEGRWYRPWLRTTPLWVPPSKAGAAQDTIEVLASLELGKRCCVGALASERKVAFLYEADGHLAIVKLTDGSLLPQHVTTQEGRPLRLKVDSTGRFLLIAFDGGKAELLCLDYSENGDFLRQTRLVVLDYHQPKHELPALALIDGQMWYQSATRTLTRLKLSNDPVLDREDFELPQEIGEVELSGIAKSGQEVMIGLRRGRDTVMLLLRETSIISRLDLPETDLVNLCTLASGSIAAALTSYVLTVFRAKDSIQLQSEFKLDELPAAMAVNGSQLVWISERASIHSWQIGGNESLHPIAADARRLFFAMDLAATAEGQLLALTGLGTMRFRVVRSTRAEGLAISAIFPAGAGVTDYYALEDKSDGVYLVDGVSHGRCSVAGGEPSQHVFALQRGGWVLGARAKGGGFVLNLAVGMSIPVVDIPEGVTSAAGNPREGFWLTGLNGRIFFVTARGECRRSRRLKLENISRSSIQCWAGLLLWSGLCRIRTAEGQDMVDYLMFFKPDDAKLGHLFEIGGRWFATQYGVLEAIAYHPGRDRLVIFWSKGVMHGSPQDFVAGSERMETEKGIGEVLVDARFDVTGAHLFVLSQSGAVLDLDAQDFAVQAVFSGSWPITHISPESDSALSILVVEDQSRPFRITLQSGGRSCI